MENRKLILFVEVDINCDSDFDSRNLKDAVLIIENQSEYTVLNTSINVINFENDSKPIWIKPRN